MAFSAYRPDDPLDVLGAWRKAAEALDASIYGRAPVAAHVLVMIPPACIIEAGDAHDPKNPVNEMLVREGQVWAETVFGNGSVIAGRLDLDEAGWGVLDLVVMPVRLKRMNKSSEKNIISVNSALEELRRAYGTEKSFQALQTSWAEHAAATIDPRLLRGIPKAESGRTHVHADIYRAAAQEAVAKARADAEKLVADEIKERLAAIKAEEERLRLQADELARWQEILNDGKANLEAHWRRILTAHAAVQEQARTAVKNVLNGIRIGIEATLDGRIEGVALTSSGRHQLELSEDLSETEGARLHTLLRPAWKAGLAQVIAALTNADVVGRSIGTPISSGL